MGRRKGVHWSVGLAREDIGFLVGRQKTREVVVGLVSSLKQRRPLYIYATEAVEATRKEPEFTTPS